MILIISSETDDHTVPVLERLEERDVDARLFDFSAFPRHLRVVARYDGESRSYQLIDGTDVVDLSECNVAWWRRPQPFGVHDELTEPADNRFAYNESVQAVNGLLLSLDAEWVNDPSLDEEAGRKLYQLRVAQEVGFEIPQTLVTNSPKEAWEFVNEHGPASTVYKSFMALPEIWRETRVFKPGETQLLHEVELAPVIFQEYVTADVDLRITVVGERIFTAAIHSSETSYPVDYRTELGDALVESEDLPQSVRDKIRAFMDRLGLLYGAIDMRRTPDGRYVFLEINPAGLWLFAEDATGLPITDAVVDLLVDLDENHSAPERTEGTETTDSNERDDERS